MRETAAFHISQVLFRSSCSRANLALMACENAVEKYL